jgi:hypothetical protein
MGFSLHIQGCEVSDLVDGCSGRAELRFLFHEIITSLMVRDAMCGLFVLTDSNYPALAKYQMACIL